MTTRNNHPERLSRKCHNAVAREIAEIGRGFYSRGWVFGTGGNLSGVVRQNPLRLAITASGVDKGSLTPSQILQTDGREKVIRGKYKPSGEAAIHVAIVRA